MDSPGRRTLSSSLFVIVNDDYCSDDETKMNK